MSTTTYRVRIDGRELALSNAADAGVLSESGFRVTAETTAETTES